MTTTPTPPPMPAETRTMYMHTLDGQPATMEPDGTSYRQVCFAGRGPVTLCESLKQIRREQAESARNRAALGFGSDRRYDYARVAVPVAARRATPTGERTA